ncbi:DASH complex subunit dam1 [Tieghemiomyces parasiticus]|uniref:DASH complex subunit DAM1 n=1 Tax=Tieghemiomyces parasiticus TaxID=78921 RepID=A0A9W8DQL1_9FUNG|nr:DASH complex subunit dam1 [Tieghemiomyces parasiticus]
MPISEHIQRPLVDITDQMGELQRNMQALQDLNQHFVRFNVSFGSFLLGIKANTQVVDFSEAPISDSYDLASDARLSAMSSRSPTPPPPPPPSQSGPPSSAGPVSKLRAPSVGRATKNLPAKSKASGQRKMTVAAALKVIFSNIPKKFHEQPHKGHVDTIVKIMFKQKDGVYLHDVIREASLSRTRATEYLNLLVNSGHASVLSKKGLLYVLDPQRYPR